MKYLTLLLVTLLVLTVSPIVAQTEPQLRLSEIYYNTPGSDESEEWVELVNLGDAPLSLESVKVGDEETKGEGEGMVQFPPGATISEDQVIVVAQSAAGFSALFGQNPDYEIQDTDPAVPDMLPYPDWATGDLILRNDGDELILLDAEDTIIDAVSYGDNTTFFTPGVGSVLAGQSIERIPVLCDRDRAADWQPQLSPSPGVVTLEGECGEEVLTAPDLSGRSFIPIGQIQGSGERTPLLNESVAFTGIVTGIYEDQNSRGIIYYTLFVQEMPGAGDGDPETSDAIAVFLGTTAPSVAPGDEVAVSGQVTEFFGFTEIGDDGVEVALLSRDNPLPPPIPLEPPPVDSRSYYEPFEAMRVTLPEALVVGPTYRGCGFAVVTPAAGVDRILRERIEDPLDLIVPVLHNSDVTCGDFPNVKSGDIVSGLGGPLIYHFDQFKIVQQDPLALDVTEAPLQPLPPPPVLAGGLFTVASFNVENYFDTVDDTGSDAEPKPTPAELAVKQAKIANTIVEALGCPTLLGIQEVEHESLLLELSAMLAGPCNFIYDVSHLESPDARGIDVALLSNPRHVSIQSVSLQQTCTRLDTDIADPDDLCGLSSDPLFSRPPLRVDLLLGDQPYTVYVNHFKSKSGGETETAPRRLEQAAHLSALVSEQLAASPGARILAIGDFNDYARSPALLQMTEDGPLQNAMLAVPDESRYSYIFGGASQLLDAILISPAVADDVASASIIHSNADYPAAWATDPETIFHSSDHDIPLIVLSTGDTGGAPIATQATPAMPDALPDPTGQSRVFTALAVVSAGIVVALVLALLVWRQRRRHSA